MPDGRVRYGDAVTFRFIPLDIPEVALVEPDTFADDRGFFRTIYSRVAFAESGIDFALVQADVSRSARGVLRGLHFRQEPVAAVTLVTVTEGRIFGVAADMRPGSPTFRRWVSAELSGQDGRILVVPNGFAHGSVALEEGTTVSSYLLTDELRPAHDAGIRWNDPDIAVAWPIAEPILSPQDEALPFLREITTTAEQDGQGR